MRTFFMTLVMKLRLFLARVMRVFLMVAVSVSSTFLRYLMVSGFGMPKSLFRISVSWRFA